MIQTVDVAMSQLGVAEATHHNDGIPAERYSRGDQVPWCAALVLWSNANSDDHKIAPTDKDYYWCRSVQHMEDRCRALGWWFDHGTTPQRNDIIFFQTRGASDPGVGRHVGIVTGVHEGWVYTIEGNTSDKVAERKYRLDDVYITGYARIPA